MCKSAIAPARLRLFPPVLRESARASAFVIAYFRRTCNNNARKHAFKARNGNQQSNAVQKDTLHTRRWNLGDRRRRRPSSIPWAESGLLRACNTMPTSTSRTYRSTIQSAGARTKRTDAGWVGVGRGVVCEPPLRTSAPRCATCEDQTSPSARGSEATRGAVIEHKVRIAAQKHQAWPRTASSTAVQTQQACQAEHSGVDASG
eukprot:3937790-Rhodomonas_salina.6